MKVAAVEHAEQLQAAVKQQAEELEQLRASLEREKEAALTQLQQLHQEKLTEQAGRFEHKIQGTMYKLLVIGAAKSEMINL